MAVRLFTDDPSKALGALKRMIDEGHIDTWRYDSQGDFTHTAASGQWKNKAWLRPKLCADRLEMNIIRPKNGSVDREVYAVYHGRFIETAVAHIPKLFTVGAATAGATDHDLV
ncbi:MAG: hypothetical protein ABR973_01955 [Candidatus Acidiferrales bacterium]|jgi:hypothetical protein